ncbi:MAG: hypothetical protein LBQ39_07010 [Tannerellaceae bacterium]|jgi:hypothetical protein|nr:hypothetical protein [Tannerellaceae bacterium]
MNDLSVHRLNSFTELDAICEKIGKEKFHCYRELVYSQLGSLPAGILFSVVDKVRVENQEVFIKMACLYMSETEGNCNIEFTGDYTKIKGIRSFNQEKMDMEEIRRIRDKMKSNY